MGILLVVQLIFFLLGRKPKHLLVAMSALLLTLIYVGNLGLGISRSFPTIARQFLKGESAYFIIAQRA